jgi:hypothetical protein
MATHTYLNGITEAISTSLYSPAGSRFVESSIDILTDLFKFVDENGRFPVKGEIDYLDIPENSKKNKFPLSNTLNSIKKGISDFEYRIFNIINRLIKLNADQNKLNILVSILSRMFPAQNSNGRDTFKYDDIKDESGNTIGKKLVEAHFTSLSSSVFMELATTPARDLTLADMYRNQVFLDNFAKYVANFDTLDKNKLNDPNSFESYLKRTSKISSLLFLEDFISTNNYAINKFNLILSSALDVNSTGLSASFLSANNSNSVGYSIALSDDLNGTWQSHYNSNIRDLEIKKIFNHNPGIAKQINIALSRSYKYISNSNIRERHELTIRFRQVMLNEYLSKHLSEDELAKWKDVSSRAGLYVYLFSPSGYYSCMWFFNDKKQLKSAETNGYNSVGTRADIRDLDNVGCL